MEYIILNNTTVKRYCDLKKLPLSLGKILTTEYQKASDSSGRTANSNRNDEENLFIHYHISVCGYTIIKISQTNIGNKNISFYVDYKLHNTNSFKFLKNVNNNLVFETVDNEKDLLSLSNESFIEEFEKQIKTIINQNN